MLNVIKVLLGSLLIALIAFMPRHNFSVELPKEENFISCCEDKIGNENNCENSSHENKKCEGDCFANCCCCFKFESKIEKHAQIEVGIFQNQSKILDMYTSKYKYSFHYNIYKPPIYFIS